ncbi:MAG: hypothetical protein ABIP64_17520, partial [Burkholderiales bacterium]
ASVLTLLGDRRLHRHAIERRLRSISGDYTITANTPQRDTSKERIEIRLVSGRRFSITANGGPTGNWAGHFIVSDESLNVAHGIYQYPGSTDWGQHEYLLDEATGSLFVYGVNRSKPGMFDPFSIVLSRIATNESQAA